MQSSVDKQYGNFTECAEIKGEAKANLKWRKGVDERGAVAGAIVAVVSGER